jgi:hypothetical protein
MIGREEEIAVTARHRRHRGWASAFSEIPSGSEGSISANNSFCGNT